MSKTTKENSIATKVCKDRYSSCKNHNEAAFTILQIILYKQRQQQLMPTLSMK